MSKARNANDSLLSMNAMAWRRRIQQLTLPMEMNWPRDAAEVIEANAGFVADDILSHPEKYQLKSLRRVKGKGYTIGADDLSAVLRHLFHAGFLEALLMHRRELMAVGDWVEWKQKQGGGGDTGRARQTAAKLNRAAQAQSLLSEGNDVPEIAKRLGRSISTVYRALGAAPAPRAKVTRPRRKR